MTPETLSLSLALSLFLGVPSAYADTPLYTNLGQMDPVCRSMSYSRYSSSCSYSIIGAKRIVGNLLLILDRVKKNIINGEEAEPMQERSFYSALRFALCLEADTQDAYVGVDPDGEVYFEWYKDSENQCTVTFSGADNRIHCMKDNGGKPSVMISTEFNDIKAMIGDAIRI